MNKKIAWLLIALLINILACVNNKVEPETSCTTPLPNLVSFKNDIQPIFNKNCNEATCHSGSSPGGKLNLEPSQSFANLSKVGRGYIDSIKPESSVLYAMLISKSNPMPPNGKLNDCSLKLIYKWMEQNAPNN